MKLVNAAGLEPAGRKVPVGSSPTLVISLSDGTVDVVLSKSIVRKDVRVRLPSWAYGFVAHRKERLVAIQEVEGSIPSLPLV